ncbi:hypothetical protein [Halomonas sp. BM-2019]|uniref:hypothetical protein n=1 Tax=Halomonas sp. BM-2019 TaxID=2811227 RepID=UPI001B3C1A9C|nr:MAG: hypothetical protein J5F18_04670 [Halomonas sp. BM-2019]
MSLRSLPVASLSLLLAGCQAISPSGDAQAPSQWDRFGLEAQPRLAAHRAALPGGLGFDPGTTGWQEAGQALPEGLTRDGQRHASPAALLQALVTELDLAATLGQEVWEQTQRLHLADDTAVGVVLQWGFKDDAVLGQDYRLTMSEDADGWYTERLEIRYHCGRGVSDDGLCL